ncbi:YisL family protein [Sediminibacillus albus]|uniref:UPF0344 protein SAMN05216243_1263 n=1 Tax=Sediminibacillus albus TaxID=407036 RepID=A0A1G8XBD5_9BACI|nr:YisL family protein [Sediminibacillus albus]SDJ87704.1 Protein of unknown function [Sediminibacillus albus]
MTHLHITSWVLAFILFGLALMLNKQGKNKPGKILHMILRLDYLLILYSGGELLMNYFNPSYMLGEVIVKALAGLWVIAVMEMILGKYRKGKPVLGVWVQFAIAVVIVLALGFGRLPLGFLP